MPPEPGKLIDTILDIQRDTGFWETERNLPGYLTMDATYILSRLGDAVGYPKEPRLRALSRTADSMNAYFACHPIDGAFDSHLLAANLHALGLLSEVFPERYEFSVQWRFGWDIPEMFVTKVIADHLASLW